MPRPTPEASPAGRAAFRRVRQAVRILLLRSHGYVQAVAREAHLHESDVRAVGVLRAAEGGDSGPVTAGRLARELALTPAAVSAMLGRMEANGHVRRARAAVDGRSVVLQATSSAHQASDQLFEPMVDAYDEVLGRYDDEQLALVVQVLEELVDATERALASRPSSPTPGRPQDHPRPGRTPE